MILKHLIEMLEKEPREKVVRHGFSRPHSYRGDYAQLAFRPTDNITVGAMLDDARSALGKYFQGYKGGDYHMNEWTDVFIAEYGETGEAIGPTLLRYMLGESKSMSKQFCSFTIWRGVEVGDVEEIKHHNSYSEAIAEIQNNPYFDVEDDLPVIIELTAGKLTDVIIPSRKDVTPNT